jgi:NADH-quinone oxidoreductase subunit G
MTQQITEQSTDQITVTIDGIETNVTKGTLIIRAAEQLGIAIPRFCDHPLLEPAAACRMCLIEIDGQPKPQPACAVTCGDGMVVRTQLTSQVADEAQAGVMELLLINHPLDCPICDKGGECPLQNQAMTAGRAVSRFDGPKRTFPKPIALSTQVLLDRERCVSCARCTRFSEEIAGDPFIELLDRGSQQQVGIAESQTFQSYYSGNTIQICPVGALTSSLYRFRARPFDLVSTPTTCEHCASGCALRTDTRANTIQRRLAATSPEVNEEWNCDKGRFAFAYVTADDRLSTPHVGKGEAQTTASWSEALTTAAAGLRDAGSVAVLTGGRLTYEDAYAYSKFARVALQTNDVDFRARAHSVEEEQFLAAHVAGTGLGVTYADLESAPVVLLVAFEPEDESPIVALRLRKAVRLNGTKVHTLAPFTSRGSDKLSAHVIPVTPGAEAVALDALTADAGAALRQPGAVILVGERAGALPGTLSAVVRLAEASGARIGWVPRRAGDRGAVEAGLLPDLLPGGRPVDVAEARVDAATVWGVGSLPSERGRDATQILEAAARGEIKALVVAGVDPDDLPDPASARAALAAVRFLVAIDTRSHWLTGQADVVLPVAAAPEKSGTFLNWEGRARRSRAAVPDTSLRPDSWVLTALAAELGQSLQLSTPEQAAAELAEFEPWSGARGELTDVAAPEVPGPGAGFAVLASWRLLLDDGVLQEDEPYLAGTARPAVIGLSAATAVELAVSDGDAVTVSSETGSVTHPVEVADLPDRVVFVPGHSHGRIATDLGVGPGAIVTVSNGSAS